MPPKTSKKSKHLAGVRRAKDKEARKARKIKRSETRDVGTQTKLRKEVPIKDLINRLLQRRRDEHRARRHRARLALKEKIAEIRMKARSRYREARRATRKAKMGDNLRKVIKQVHDPQANSTIGTGIGMGPLYSSGGDGGVFPKYE